MVTSSESGTRRGVSESASEPGSASARDPELLARIHATMVLTRAVEDRMVAMYKGGDLLGSLYTGHWHEGISVGAASALRQDDYLAPIHRDLGARTCGGGWSRGR
jgi:TPP-dependent pyruvate/acetoin dehydrogenase alpha subunit